MCRSDGESVNHLLIHCPVAWELWNFVLNLFHLSWVMPRSIKEIFRSWSLYKRRKRSSLWDAAPLAVYWTIWKERNQRAFDNEVMSIARLKESIVKILSLLCNESVMGEGNSFVETRVNSFVV